MTGAAGGTTGTGSIGGTDPAGGLVGMLVSFCFAEELYVVVYPKLPNSCTAEPAATKTAIMKAIKTTTASSTNTVST